MIKKTNGEARSSPENIDQIRDIIFGAQKREYDARFQNIEAALASFRQQTTGQLEELRDMIAREISAAVQSLDKKVKLLSTALQEETAAGRKQLEQVEKKISANLAALTQETNDEASSIRNNVTETRAKLQQEIRTLRDQLREELNRNMGSLENAKVSRETLSELLLELGMKMKGVEVASELQKAAKARNEE